MLVSVQDVVSPDDYRLARQLKISHLLPEWTIMGKEQKTQKNVKKQPAMTPKEKKAAKKIKKDAK